MGSQETPCTANQGQCQGRCQGRCLFRCPVEPTPALHTSVEEDLAGPLEEADTILAQSEEEADTTLVLSQEEADTTLASSLEEADTTQEAAEPSLDAVMPAVVVPYHFPSALQQ